MKKKIIVLGAIVAVLAIAFGLYQRDGSAHAAETIPAGVPTDGPRMTLTTKFGDVIIILRPDLAPNHVERITTLANDGFYDGIVFHRVISGFMAQTGDPLGTGGGGSDLPDVDAEFSPTPYVRGTLGAARTNDPNTFNSQFFITFGESPFLNGQYTVFGHVIDGMDHIDALKKGSGQSGSVKDPDSIISMRVTAAQ